MIGHIKSGQYLKNIARAILKKYCPPCHKARGIHDFILATKRSVWIIILLIADITVCQSVKGTEAGKDITAKLIVDLLIVLY